MHHMYSHIPHPDLDICNQIPQDRISEVRPRPRWWHQLVHRSFLIYQHFEGLDLAVLTGTKQRRAVLGITCVDIHCPPNRRCKCSRFYRHQNGQKIQKISEMCTWPINKRETFDLRNQFASGESHPMLKEKVFVWWLCQAKCQGTLGGIRNGFIISLLKPKIKKCHSNHDNPTSIDIIPGIIIDVETGPSKTIVSFTIG